MRTPFVSPLLSNLPSLLLSAGLLTALVLTLLWRAKVGRAVYFAAAGLGLLLATQLLYLVFQIAVLPWIFREADPSTIGAYFAIQSLISTVLQLGGLGLIVAAVFAGRLTPAPSAMQR